MGTIFRPQFLYPSNISLDMSVEQTFTCLIDGQRITGYDINIYDNSDNTLEYTDSVTFTSENYLYNNETLGIDIPSTSGCVNGNEYKWNITYYNGTESVTSQERLFYAAGDPSFSISVPATVEAQGYEFIGTYSQSESVGVRYWYYELYDNTDALLQRSDRSYNSDISLSVYGFLNGESYQIKGYLETEQGVKISTEMYSFNVSYTPVDLEIGIYTFYVSNKTAPHIYLPEGSVDGAYSYVADLFVSDNYGINLDSSSVLTYVFDEEFGENFTVYFDMVVTSEFDGDIIKLINTDDDSYYLVGYDTSLEKFYYDINGTVVYSEELYVVSSKVYIISLTPTEMFINEHVYEDAQYLTSEEYEFFDANEDFLFVQYSS